MRYAFVKKLIYALILCFSFSSLASASEEKSDKVRFQTNYGDIVLELNSEKAPITVANFKKYVTNGHYDGTVFHRIIGNFMIQGGGFRPGLIKMETDKPIKNESNNGLSNEYGTIAMARQQDPHSATAQFYINVNNNSALDYNSPMTRGWGYAVFGKVVEGLDVVKEIAKVSTKTVKWMKNVPIKDVIIEKAEMVQ
jgi:peptidyl-prolyl cis-trans isomerase B (cyclophilin B)